jgi:hypothetical protein
MVMQEVASEPVMTHRLPASRATPFALMKLPPAGATVFPSMRRRSWQRARPEKMAVPRPQPRIADGHGHRRLRRYASSLPCRRRALPRAGRRR